MKMESCFKSEYKIFLPFACEKNLMTFTTLANKLIKYYVSFLLIEINYRRFSLTTLYLAGNATNFITSYLRPKLNYIAKKFFSCQLICQFVMFINVKAIYVTSCLMDLLHALEMT